MRKKLDGRIRRAWRVGASLFVLTGALALIAVPYAPAIAEDDSRELMHIKASDFDENSINVDNPWMPLKPGMQYVFDGYSEEDGEKVEHRVVFTVTDLVKVINGISCVVVFDRDFTEGRLLEAELTYFAQDKAGNVWHLGQYTEMYDEVELVGGRAWMVGHLDGALAGIMMMAKPEVSSESYSQGFAPAPFNWTDRARTAKMGEKTTVPFGSFKNVLVSEEFNEEEPGAIQLKYYASGMGVVRVGWAGDDNQKEELELVDVVELNSQAMEKVRKGAMKLETRAYVYCSTLPAQVRPSTGQGVRSSASGSGDNQ